MLTKCLKFAALSRMGVLAENVEFFFANINVYPCFMISDRAKLFYNYCNFNLYYHYLGLIMSQEYGLGGSPQDGSPHRSPI